MRMVLMTKMCVKLLGCMNIDILEFESNTNIKKKHLRILNQLSNMCAERKKKKKDEHANIIFFSLTS